MKDNTISPASLSAIANRFFTDICAAHDFPELLITGHRYDGKHGGLVLEGEVSPRGQISAIVETLTVKITLAVSADKPRCMGFVELNFQHRGGGSNGFVTRYFVAAKHCCGGHEYAGCMEQGVFQAVQDSFMR